MPFHQEATFHDRQAVGSTDVQQTTSEVFTDIIGATIVAKDLSQAGSYFGWLSALLSNSENNSDGLFRLTLNGVPIGSTATIKLRTKDSDVGYTLLGNLDGIDIVGDDVIQVQFATNAGTLTLVEFSLMVDGIPSSRVI